MYKNCIKRLLDIVLSFMAIVFLSPIFLVFAIIIKCTSKGPVFFTQQRVGKNKKLFKMLKFRSMREDAPKDCPTHLLEDPEVYITKVGRFMRKTSIDELPQIFNIFVGQMSIIGPRPALYNQDDLIQERDKYGANDVRPGLTGWAQINGRDELEIPVKAKFDGEYVEKLSFAMDCKCFFGTISKVLKGSGVVEGVHDKPSDEEKEEIIADGVLDGDNDNDENAESVASEESEKPVEEYYEKGTNNWQK